MIFCIPPIVGIPANAAPPSISNPISLILSIRPANSFAFALRFLSSAAFLTKVDAIVSSNAALASSYPWKVHASKCTWIYSCSSLSREALVSSRIVDFPAPQSPKTPILIGINSFSVIRSFIDSAVSLKFKKSIFDSLSDHITSPFIYYFFCSILSIVR
ncbi:hypothetical protein P20311_0692 [Pseudoalteromonas sp. BSi20311]|nr:hypothetical protein P20311_0692 [Pseudoalteromonas sp. BSi20311]GAA70299.1 hypothetical protein P20439_0365 [Pseudoalteromonas sp. BSi20439]